MAFSQPIKGRDFRFLFFEVEDETRNSSEFWPFSKPFLRTRLLFLVFRDRGQDEARNFATFLGHFKVETRPSRISGSNKRSVLINRTVSSYWNQRVAFWEPFQPFHSLHIFCTVVAEWLKIYNDYVYDRVTGLIYAHMIHVSVCTMDLILFFHQVRFV